MGVSGTGVAAVGIGALFIWGGIKGFSPLKAFQNVTRGKSGSAGQSVATLSNPDAVSSSAGPTSGPTVTDSSLANDALKYNGIHNYGYGAAPKTGKMDCSSYMNTVIGTDGKLPIPDWDAGTYDGQEHGPGSVTWMTTGLCKTIPKTQAQAGDLAIGPTHMGMFVDGFNYISDHDVQEGISIKPVTTFPDIAWICRRYVGAS